MSRGKKSIGREERASQSQSAPKDAKVTKSTRGGKKRGTTSAKAKRPSMFAAVMYDRYDNKTGLALPPQPPRESVLIRATAKAKHIRKVHPKTLLPSDHVDWLKDDQTHLDLNIFHRKLTHELRNKIFRLVVADNRHLVYVGSTNTKEQPDLAMTCRAIRREVLELYYAENTFAIMLEAFRGSKSQRATIQEEWLAMLEDSGYLNQVRHWAFADEIVLEPAEVTDMTALSPAAMRPAIETYIVSMSQGSSLGTGGQHGVADFSNPDLEVHTDAMCLLRCCGKAVCEVKTCPSWFNNIFIDALLDPANGKVGLDVERMVGMLELLAERAEEIMRLRCGRDHIIDDAFDMPKYLGSA